jgi:hypothetical protein
MNWEAQVMIMVPILLIVLYITQNFQYEGQLSYFRNMLEVNHFSHFLLFSQKNGDV